MRNFQASVAVERLWGGDLTVQTLVEYGDVRCIHLANTALVALFFYRPRGVLTVKKDGYKKKHDDVDVPNLHVMMVMKSLESEVSRRMGVITSYRLLYSLSGSTLK